MLPVLNQCPPPPFFCPLTNSIIHIGANLLPRSQLNIATQRLQSANGGVTSLLVCLFVVAWFATLNAIVGKPSEGDAVSTLSFATSVMAGLVFVLYNTHIPQHKYVAVSPGLRFVSLTVV